MPKCTNTKCGSDRVVKSKTAYTYHDIYDCLDCGSWNFKKIDDCCRDPYTIVTIDHYNHDLKFIRRQCYNCGGCTEMTKPLSSKIYGNEIRGEFSKERLQEWKKNRQDEADDLASVKKEQRLYSSRYYQYMTYLSSYEWRDKRQLVLVRDKNKCRQCEATLLLEVHHLTYDNFGNEPLDDLLTLCNNCHSTIHGKTSSIYSNNV